MKIRETKYREGRDKAIKRQAARYFEPIPKICCASCAYVMESGSGPKRKHICGRWSFQVSPTGICEVGYCPGDPSIFGLMRMKEKPVQPLLCELKEEAAK